MAGELPAGSGETNAHRETGQADIRDRGRHVALDHIRRGDGQDLPLRPGPQEWHHGEHQRTESATHGATSNGSGPTAASDPAFEGDRQESQVGPQTVDDRLLGLERPGRAVPPAWSSPPMAERPNRSIRFGPHDEAARSPATATPSDSHSDQPAGSYHWCIRVPSAARAKTSIRSAPHEHTAGEPTNEPPCPCHGCHARPSQ